MNKIIKLILCILLTLSVGAISGIATPIGVNDWFLAINKPSFNPPNYVFAPVWTLLYILMGISLFMVLQSSSSKPKKYVITIFFVQLLLNFCWSFLFFVVWKEEEISLIKFLNITIKTSNHGLGLKMLP